MTGPVAIFPKPEAPVVSPSTPSSSGFTLSELAEELRTDPGDLSLRLGTISAVDDANKKCSVRLAGSSTEATGVSYVNYRPIVNDVVLIFQNGPDLIVWGKPGSQGISTILNVKDWGAKGDGAADDTTPISQCISSASSGDIIYFPKGTYKTNPQTVNKQLHFLGDGMWDSWLKSISVSQTAATVTFNITTGPSGTQHNYGPSFKNMGIDLYASPAAIGISLTNTVGWAEIDHYYIQGGAVQISHAMPNCSFSNGVMVDGNKFFSIVESGLELILNDIVMEVLTLPCNKAIELQCSSGGIKGAIFYNDIRVNVNNVPGVSLSAGLWAQAPSNASAPIMGENLTVDNCSGAALVLINISDCEITDGWLNGAAGTGGAVYISGGINLKFMNNNYFGGSGAGGCTYEFAGGLTAGVVSIGNTCPTAVVYKFPATNKPTHIVAKDRTGATTYGQLTNDYAALYAAVDIEWTTLKLAQEADHFVGATGEPAFVNSWANVGSTWTPLFFFKDAMGMVHVEGVIQNGTAQSIFTLPFGYRPGADEVCMCTSATGGAMPITVNTAGVVATTIAPTSVVYINLHFRAAGVGW